MRSLQEDVFQKDRDYPYIVRRLLLDAMIYDYFTWELRMRIGHNV